MQELPPQVANWLYTAIQPQYVNKKVAYSHIYQFLLIHLNRNLKFRIRTSVYTSNSNGLSRLLINLFGNIEIRNAEKCSVAIWIPFEYPFNHDTSDIDRKGVPIVFVTTDQAQSYIRANNYIDRLGRFYHPYLASWGSSYPRDSHNYTLIALINIPYETLQRDIVIDHLEIEPGILRASNRNAPKLPPKPAKVPLESTSIPHRDNSTLVSSTAHGILDAASPGHASQIINPRYSAPLPLPNERPELDFALAPMYAQTTSMAPQGKPSLKDRIDKESTDAHANRMTNVKYEDVDLVDKVMPEQSLSHELQITTGLIDQKINSLLSLDGNEGITSVASDAFSNSSHINSKYQQFLHQCQQSKANLVNLQNHTQYLSNEIKNITSLNRQLVHLDSLNSAQKRLVYTSEGDHINLDDIVIPDLALVAQLYQTVSEINAIKDTINLIGGSFQSEAEIINNERVDPCLKIVRNLGRELFWLEIMKQEIAYKYMSLSR